jgi:hypothetical protein
MSTPQENYSNFVTPPDFVDDPKHTVLLLDVDQASVQRIAEWCQLSPVDFNVYVFDASMEVTEWLLHAVNRSNAIVVNTAETILSQGKDRLCENAQTWYFGPKRFLKNSRQAIADPLDYFKEYAESVK